MPDEAQTIRSLNWRELFPFLNIFRAFWIAVHPSKLILALIALLLIYFGGRVLDVIWSFGPDTNLVRPGERMFRPSINNPTAPRGVFISFFNDEVGQIRPAMEQFMALEFAAGAHHIWRFLTAGPAWLFTEHPFFAILFTAWFLLIWSVFGGAISRIAAVHVARDEKISVRQALRFSVSKCLSFLFAPIIPLLIVLVLGVLIAAGGLLYYIPWVGPILAGLLFFLALAAGFLCVLALIGLLGGVNLMYPTVAVEGSDSFDAISRSFSYVFSRPWRMLWYTLVALVYGALCYLFVRFVIYLVLVVTHFFVSWWLRGQPATYFPDMWPMPTWDSLPYEPRYNNPAPPHNDHLKFTESFAAGLMSMWIYLVIGLLGAFAISFYFSVSTIIYYLMRREVDATELDDVYLEDADDEFGEAALGGPDGGPGGGAPGGVVPVGGLGATPAPAAGTTSAPGGGVTGTAGSAAPGGTATGAAQPYSPPATEAPAHDRGEIHRGPPQSPPA